MQMVDVILPLNVISKYTHLIKPLTRLSLSIEKNTDITRGKSVETPLTGITNLNNELLPLIHFEFKGFRLMMPALNDTNKLQHDLLMLQVVKYCVYLILLEIVKLLYLFINVIYSWMVFILHQMQKIQFVGLHYELIYIS